MTTTKPTPKGHVRGTHRMVPPAQTLERVRPLMPVMGITRIANVTGLDSIGIPVTVVCRPNARSLAVSQGKGLDLVAAKVSGLMESVEAYHGETITLPLKIATYEELRYTHAVVDVERLPRAPNGLFHPHLSMAWIEGFDLIQREPVWLPYDVVHVNYTARMRWTKTGFVCSSNGLASGNHMLEAIEHAICEVVERDAVTMWRLLDPERRAETRVDPATIDDPGCRSVLERYEAAGVAVALWEITSDVGISTFHCRIMDEGDQPFRRLGYAEGMGCHPAREIACLRALTEAAQSRLAMISGSRDDMLREYYVQLRSPDRMDQYRRELDASRPTRSFRDCATTENATFDADVAWEVERLKSIGIERAVVVDLSKPEFGIAVARVVIPGLESLAIAHNYVPGARARNRMRERA